MLPRLLLVSHLNLGGHVDANNQSEQTDSRSEDFHDENLDEQSRVGRICQSSTGTHNSDSDTTEQINQTDGQASTEHYITGEPVVVPDVLVGHNRSPGEAFQHTGQDDSRDQTVNGNSLAEDNRDQILGLDTGSYDIKGSSD